jgi:endonuclease YncB( thermonuclease family)
LRQMQSAALLFVVIIVLLSLALPQAFAAVRVSSFAIVDEDGDSLQDDDAARVGGAVTIQSTLQNTDNQTQQQPFVYIVQVQDPSGYAVFLSLVDGALSSDRTLRTSWIPEQAGEHAVQVFVWENIESPVQLAPPTKSSIDVKAQECAGSASCFTATVTRIVDGDTIRTGDISIRLTLVNTPERGDEGYSEAKEFTSALCPVGSTVLVDEDDGQIEGSYGRMVAKVYCGGKMLNEELLNAGHAVMYESFCDVSEFGKEDWAVRYGC